MRTLDSKKFLINLMEQFNLNDGQVAGLLGIDIGQVKAWTDYTCCDDVPTHDQLRQLQRSAALKPVSSLVFSEVKAVKELESIKNEMVEKGETGWLSRISNVINMLT